MNYWEECLKEAISEAEIIANEKQIKILVNFVEGAFDNYSQAHGYDAIGCPSNDEIDKLKEELEKERSKRICSECGGTGWIRSLGPYHGSESQCFRCNGEGRM